MATNQTATDYTGSNHIHYYDSAEDMYWLETQLSLLHDHHDHPAGVATDGYMNQWLAERMVEPDELQDHITELAAELKMRRVGAVSEMEVLRFKTDRPEIKEAARLLDEQDRYNVEMLYEGAIISIKRIRHDIE